MAATNSADTDELLKRAGQGDRSAGQALLTRYRSRLKRMIGVRLDARLAARIDPSDVVQETLFDAAGRLSDYLRRPPLPFYPWLRQIAWDKLERLHRHHLQARKRSAAREDHPRPGLSDESVQHLAARMFAPGPSPSTHVIQAEQRRRVRDALARLSPRHREILVLRYLEGLNLQETAEIVGISEGAVSMRQLRALEKLRELLTGEEDESALGNRGP